MGQRPGGHADDDLRDPVPGGIADAAGGGPAPPGVGWRSLTPIGYTMMREQAATVLLAFIVHRVGGTVLNLGWSTSP